MKRVAREEDVDMVLPLLQVGYAGQEWTPGDVQAVMRAKGIHLVDTESRAYLFLNVTDLSRELGPLSPGPCTQIASLLPQHHDQKWVDEVLAPLLARGVRKVARDFPDRAALPLYCFLTPELLKFWTHIIPAEIKPRSSGQHLATLPTLQIAIDKLKGY
ncbi:hypothetical protein LCGC14_1598480 [marine sediment metagenome]|uniref:Uncharacterized protein n=1 Tax=marine sediment metagenome TaxID=412755 RepID=A0A0F9LC25_9ZZZZ